MKNLLLITVLIVLASTPCLYADFIREENGNLTTDLPGATIVTGGLPDQWIIDIPVGTPPVGAPGQVFGLLGQYDTFPEPENPNAYNLLEQSVPTSSVWRFSLRSEVPKDTEFSWHGGPLPIFSAGVKFAYYDPQGVYHAVFLEDISDAPNTGVPDAGSTLPMLGLTIAGCVGLRKRFAVKPDGQF